MDQHITCPLCEKRISHKYNKGTHYWICKECPFVGFEYYHKNDIKRLSQILDPEKL